MIEVLTRTLLSVTWEVTRQCKSQKTIGPVLINLELSASVYTSISGLDETVEENGRTYHMYKDGSK
jgi:hypothetical protein